MHYISLQKESRYIIREPHLEVLSCFRKPHLGNKGAYVKIAVGLTEPPVMWSDLLDSQLTVDAERVLTPLGGATSIFAFHKGCVYVCVSVHACVCVCVWLWWMICCCGNKAITVCHPVVMWIWIQNNTSSLLPAFARKKTWNEMLSILWIVRCYGWFHRYRCLILLTYE